MSTNLPYALIIEDELDLTEIFTEALDAAGYTTRVIMDGAEAVKALEVEVPNVILLDLHLPHVSGAEILEIVRSTPALADTKVIMATANPRWADSLRGKVDLVLDKPVSFRQLRDFAARFKPVA